MLRNEIHLNAKFCHAEGETACSQCLSLAERCECTVRVVFKRWTWPWHFFNICLFALCVVRYTRRFKETRWPNNQAGRASLANRSWFTLSKFICHTHSAVVSNTYLCHISLFVCSFASLFAVVPPHAYDIAKISIYFYKIFWIGSHHWHTPFIPFEQRSRKW